AGPTNPLLLVSEGGRELPVPMLIPLSDFQPAPDLRPGGADMPALPKATATAPMESTATQSAHLSAKGRIVFEAGAGGDQESNSEVWVINADGSGQTRLTSNQFFDGQPAWSPN